jgi:single-stranded-DNA-specific exonuclease
MTIREENIPAFIERLEQHAAETMPEERAPATLSLDAIVALSEIDERLIQTLDRLEPFGAENPPPAFAAFGVSLPRRTARALRGGHLQCQVQHGDRSFPAIGFNLAEIWRPDDMPEQMDVAFRPRFNTWRGETTIQLQLLGLRPASAPR